MVRKGDDGELLSASDNAIAGLGSSRSNLDAS